MQEVHTNIDAPNQNGYCGFINIPYVSSVQKNKKCGLHGFFTKFLHLSKAFKAAFECPLVVFVILYNN